MIVLYLHDIADMFLAPGKIIDGVSKKRPSNILELLKIGIFVIFLTVCQVCFDSYNYRSIQLQVFWKVGFLKKIQNFMKTPWWNLFFIISQASDLKMCPKESFIMGLFSGILQDFAEKIFSRSPASVCFKLLISS